MPSATVLRESLFSEGSCSTGGSSGGGDAAVSAPGGVAEVEVLFAVVRQVLLSQQLEKVQEAN